MSEPFASIESLLRSERLGVLGDPKSISGVQTEINVKIHAILIDWLIEASRTLNLQMQTKISAINILDAYLSRKNVHKDDIQTTSMSATMLACMYHEVFPPMINDYVFLTDNLTTVERIRGIRNDMFITLGCNINIPSDMEYTRAFSLASGFSSKAHTICKNLLLVSKLEVTDFLPSVVVTSIGFLISVLHQENYTNVFNIPQKIVNSCANSMIILCKKLTITSLKGFKQLGSQQENDQIVETIEAVAKLNKFDVTYNDEMKTYTKSYYFVNDLTINLLPPIDVPKAIRKLGSGTFGDVKEVIFNGTSYAVKKLITYDDTTELPSFYREVSILQSLDHPNLIKLRYLVSDFRRLFFDLGNSDLKQWITDGGPLNHQMQLKLAYQMFSVLSYMHRSGSFHRDIKPQNIIVFTDNASVKFVLADLGSARGCQIALRGSAYTHEICTLWYRSPEILLGSNRYDDRLDVWSMLCTIYECAVGNALFPGDSEFDQMIKIFQVLGMPNEETWDGVTSMNNYSTRFYNYNLSVKQNFFTNNEKLSDCYKELIKTGLILNPANRPNSAILYEIVQKYNSL